ncbi:TadE family protein [Streptomyces sp. NPDC101118]|uniref:TadE family protein n=1 Tax=Streptomyces sp. NPDC101118 TaxID=3366109 RepID=UPI0037FF4161
MSGIRRLRPATGADRGQTAVEFVGTVPWIIILGLAVWQCVLVGYTISLAGNAADQGARAGAAHGAAACDAAAKRHLPRRWNTPSVSCEERAQIYKTEVVLRVPVLIPGVLDFPVDVPGHAGAAREESD